MNGRAFRRAERCRCNTSVKSTNLCAEANAAMELQARQQSRSGQSASQDAKALYDKLERVVLPLYYNDRKGFMKVMSYAIALNGSFFNTQRMLLEYASRAYLR